MCARKRSELAAASSVLLIPQFADDGLQRLDHFLAIDAGLREPQLQVERLGGRLVFEDVVLRTAGFWLRGVLVLSDGLAGGASVTGDPLDQGDHFLRVALPNYLQKQRLGGNVG